MSCGEPSHELPHLAAVAVPLPLEQPLTYTIPAPFVALARLGCRARVRVGQRRLTGLIVDLPERAPQGVELRPLDEVLDAVPVLDPQLLDLARFAADYYLAPIGEVIQAMLPGRLRPWGDQRVWLTDAGALAAPADEIEAAVVAALREGGRMSVAELMRRSGRAEIEATLAAMAERGRIGMTQGRRRGTRYLTAVAPAPGALNELLERCGRSPAGREVVRFLHDAGRPATVDEIVDAVGCGRAVVQRLVRLGVLQQFTQIERLPLGRHRLTETGPQDPIRLRPDQVHAVDVLTEAIRRREPRAFLLQGITGAGKTEVYLRAAEEVLGAGRGALLLVPEIALVPALARELRRRFGETLAILHSGVGAAEREQEWERLRRGEARLALGPRSAVFAPVPDLGLVVVDEEQDEAFKQETTPRYHARDLALVRARSAGAAALLVSATPSLESRHNADRGRFTTLTLDRRAGTAGPPAMEVIDLRSAGERKHPGEAPVSPALAEAIGDTLAAGDQVILLRNRRGYAPLLLCRACGEDHRCPACGLPRTYHKRERRLVCHYCGSRGPRPERCIRCGEAALEPIGAGTERVEERLREMFPDVPVATLDRDAVQRQGSVARVLQDFELGATRILVGTQMVAKGHHFPAVALAAVLLADTYLSFPDFRAVEKTYTLLTQLAGRAGRGDRPGRMLIQTYHPDHYAIGAVRAQDDAVFAEQELRFRRTFHYPPYTRMVQILARDRDRQRAESRLRDLAERVAKHPHARDVRVSGPAPAAFERLRGRWRFQLLLRADSGTRLRRLVRDVLPERPAGELVIDVDPYQLL
ncbi:MAG: replication restart helicase PriA [Thermoanaerobaculia bacterium]